MFLAIYKGSVGLFSIITTRDEPSKNRYYICSPSFGGYVDLANYETKADRDYAMRGIQRAARVEGTDMSLDFNMNKLSPAGRDYTKEEEQIKLSLSRECHED